MRKRYYIFIVTHDWDGQLRRIPIPVQWVAVFVGFAVVGAISLLGLAGAYGRMLSKVEHFNELRSQQHALSRQLQTERQRALQSRVEIASLGSLAGEVAALYNLHHRAALLGDPVSLSNESPDQYYQDSLRNFQVLQASAMKGLLGELDRANIPMANLWPVVGRITSSFGERLDPFNGEGAFHDGIDIATNIGAPVHATADGTVVYSGVMRGYGNVVIINHGNGIRTLYAHLSSRDVTVGEQVNVDDVIGNVGDTGRSTGPHLHYEVRVHNTPVNPYKYLLPH